MLDFAQFCANSTIEQGGPVIFIGSGHKGFRFHGQVGNQVDAETLQARVNEIGLLSQGMEDIIAAVVQPNIAMLEWESEVAPNSPKFTWLSGECNRLRLFNWLPAPKIKNNIIQNIYPMHPLATYALLRMAGEVGSDNRSVLKFFAPEFETGEQGWENAQPFSYPWFIDQHETVENGKFVLYTSDLLVDYFSDSLKVNNNQLGGKVKTAVANYEATLRVMNEYLAKTAQTPLFDEIDELMQRIIKVLLVHEIISTQNIPIASTLQNISFALELVSPEEKNTVENRLRLLCESGILFNNHGIYELSRGDRVDIQGLVSQYKADPENRPVNLLQSFLELNPLRSDEVFLEAKDYNSAYHEDKRLKVVFATPAMLSEQKTVDGKLVSYFEALEHDRQSLDINANGYEGTALFVFCESEKDIDTAKVAAAHNNQPRVVIAIPLNPVNVFDVVFTLNAVQSAWFTNKSQDFSPIDNAEVQRIRRDAKSELEKARDAYFSNAKVFWLGKSGVQIPVSEANRYEVANRMMQEVFGSKRNTFGHNEFNKRHLSLSNQVRAIFKEAGDILCDLTQPIRVNWSWAENRGGNKYLRKCFVDHQVLKVINTEGDVRFLETDKEIAHFSAALPAYAFLLKSLQDLTGKEPVNLTHFLKPLFEEYGQGQLAVALLLLLARRFYGDSLRFKRESALLNDIQFANSDEMLMLVSGISPSAVVLFEPVSEEYQAYFAKVAQCFSDQLAPAGYRYTISDAFQAVLKWWDALPVIARSLSFYEADHKPMAEAFSQLRTKDPFHFVKNDLLELLGNVPGEVLAVAKLAAIESGLKVFKSKAEGIKRKSKARF